MSRLRLLDLIIVIRIGNLCDELAEEVFQTRTILGFELLETLNVALNDLGLCREVFTHLLCIAVALVRVLVS